MSLNLLGLFKAITFTDVAVVGLQVNVLALCLNPSCLALYNGLKNGTLMSFKLKKDFGEVLVYAREQ